MIKERSILFKAEMVNAILEGRKTQTRRIVKCDSKIAGIAEPKDWNCRRVDSRMQRFEEWGSGHGLFHTQDGGIFALRCPQGKPGDRLWVRETHAFESHLDRKKASDLSHSEPVAYPADKSVRCSPHNIVQIGKMRPSIFMPRWASRILLEITDIRVERLNNISSIEVLTEGIQIPYSDGYPLIELTGKYAAVKYLPKGFKDMKPPQKSTHLVVAYFASLWESINGKGSWDSNPWVWVTEFKVINNG